MNKIYIAGKINGFPNYKQHFQRIEDMLMAKDNIICINPAKLPEGFPYEAYLPICIAMIDACDSVYMLNNWKTSKGAKVERAYAIAQGKTVLYEGAV